MYFGDYYLDREWAIKIGIVVVIFIIILIIIPLIYQLYQIHELEKHNRRIRNSIFERKFITYNSFMSRWIIKDRKGNMGDFAAGFKYNDGPGCYVIMIFRKPVENKNFRNYENIYIGQSVNVCERVHKHFTGKGNGDVYADIRNGKYVYVQIQRCKKREMNSLEKKLIRAFNATDSYNMTKGGGTRR